MNYEFSNRLNHFQTGIFAQLTLKRNELLAKNKKVYNLYVGTPDFPPPVPSIPARPPRRRYMSG